MCLFNDHFPSRNGQEVCLFCSLMEHQSFAFGRHSFYIHTYLCLHLYHFSWWGDHIRSSFAKIDLLTMIISNFKVLLLRPAACVHLSTANQGCFWKSSTVSKGVPVYSCLEGFTRSIFLLSSREKQET